MINYNRFGYKIKRDLTNFYYKIFAGIGTGETACSQRKEKQNEKKRKVGNRHKYIMGGIVAKYFPDCYCYDENANMKQGT